MKVQENARELVDYYRTLIRKADVYNNLNPYDEIDLAKQAVLKAVNEIIKQCWDYRDIDLGANYDYWIKVKHEIEENI
jgi:hypothetical protein